MTVYLPGATFAVKRPSSSVVLTIGGPRDADRDRDLHARQRQSGLIDDPAGDRRLRERGGCGEHEAEQRRAEATRDRNQ